MDGVYFYWISWIVWVVCSFFMKKSKQRLLLSIEVLILIIISPYHLQAGQMIINWSLIVLLVTCYYFLSRRTKKEKMYLFLCTLIIALAYCSFQLFELFDPIWLIFNRKWMLAIIIVYLTFMLLKDPTLRIIGMIIGACQGDLLYGIVLKDFPFIYEIGSFNFLDVIALTGIIIYCWSILEGAFHYFDVMFQKNTKEKHG